MSDNPEMSTNPEKPVTVNLRVQFGKPCLTRTGIPTAVLRDLFVAGDSPEAIAADYKIRADEVLAALRFELGTPAQKRAMAEVVGERTEYLGRAWVFNDRTFKWVAVDAESGEVSQ